MKLKTHSRKFMLPFLALAFAALTTPVSARASDLSGKLPKELPSVKKWQKRSGAFTADGASVTYELFAEPSSSYYAIIRYSVSRKSPGAKKAKKSLGQSEKLWWVVDFKNKKIRGFETGERRGWRGIIFGKCCAWKEIPPEELGSWLIREYPATKMILKYDNTLPY